MNIFFTKNELLNICKSKTFTELKEKQIIKLINDSINNPDNILRVREILYEINIKNIKMVMILRNILLYYLKSKKADEDKKFKLCKMFAEYDVEFKCHINRKYITNHCLCKLYIY